MTKLEKLYSIIENSREVGVKLREKSGTVLVIQEQRGLVLCSSSYNKKGSP